MVHVEFTLQYYQIYLIVINLLAFNIYIYDKIQAYKNSRTVSRVSEIKLLFFTLIGGSIGSLLAMLLFRHKVSKLSFMIKFNLIIIVQIIAIYYYLNHFYKV